MRGLPASRAAPCESFETPFARVAIAGDLSLAKSSFRPGKGVIYHVTSAPTAIGRQVGLNAMPHRRGHDLGGQVADHVGAVGVAMAAGVGHELFALGLVLTP